MPSPRILIAPDKFKGSLTGLEVAAAIASGIHQTCPDAQISVLPIADGGDGTLEAAVASGMERIPVTVTGPTGQPVATAYARLGSLAVVEMADSCGLSRLPGRALKGMTASSRGLGELIRTALDQGCREIVMGLGGSASTDGGMGLLAGLGARILDADGHQLLPGAAALNSVARLDLRHLHPAVREASMVIACDVDNPLLGPNGAAMVYGPQKGLGPEQAAAVDESLAHWADVVASTVGRDGRDVPGAGAGGGVGFACLSLLGASLKPGISLILDLLQFQSRLTDTDLVVTGEGSLDDQSLRGKAPIGVAKAAKHQGIPVIAVCGRNRLNPADAASAGIDDIYALESIEPDLRTSMLNAAPLLERLGRQIAMDCFITPSNR